MISPERLVRDTAALVAVSSPSGDVDGAEECLAVAFALAPDDAAVERVECSSPGHARDAILRVTGTGAARVLLLGHVDTIHAHESHRPLHEDGDQLIGSGAVDMKGGDALALALLRALPRERFAELALLLVCDEEWRTAPFAHVERFAGWDACLCFEAGQLAPGAAGGPPEPGEDTGEAVIVARKAAGTLRVTAHGRAAHAGSAPDKGANALLALAAAAQALAARHDPQGPDLQSVVPSVIRSGGAFNVVPDAGELICDSRARSLEAITTLAEAVPAEVGGARLEVEQVRAWPGMDARAATAPVLDRAGAALGAPIHAGGRGGASDASHFAPVIPVTIDGLGPRGGAAHHPDEYVSRASLEPRAAVAQAVAEAVLDA